MLNEEGFCEVSATGLVDYCGQATWGYDQLLHQTVEDGILAERQLDLYEAEILAGLDFESQLEQHFEPKYDHDMALTEDDKLVLSAIWQRVINRPDVQALHNLMESSVPEVRQHCLRTAKIAGALALKDGCEEWEIELTMTAGILHDNGKSDEGIAEITRSRQSFADNPWMRVIMSLHTWTGAQNTMAAGCEPNISTLVAGHHLVMPEGRGDPYGVLVHQEAIADEKGRKPDLRKILSYLHVADIIDAVYKPQNPAVLDTSRNYRLHLPGGYDKALEVANSMQVADRTLVVMNDLFVPQPQKLLVPRSLNSVGDAIIAA